MRFEPLSGMDAGFLYMETPTLHMHTLKVAVMRPATAGDRVPFEGFRAHLASKLPRLPSFTQRLMEIPLGLSHPVWVDDERFDLDRHIAHRTAAAPGGRAELNAIVSEIASEPLPRDRPLWQITLVEGLEGERVAFVCKLHHSMADGAAALALLVEMLSEQGADGAPQAASAAGLDLHPPTRAEITRFALGQIARTLATLPMLAWRTLTGLLGLLRRASHGAHPQLPSFFTGPRMRWNGALTARRSFATTRIDLADMRRVKRALGVTLNDVFLAICGGAMRAHLAEVEGAVPAKPLLASVPINTRPEASARTRGNHVGHLTASLCTHIADPVLRVRAIHEMTDEAKQRQMTLGADLMERWVEFTPPRAHSAVVRFWSKHHMADFVPPPVNLVVSNVPGPPKQLVIGGYTLDALYSVGPILDGIGLNITGWSYGGHVYFVGLACPDQLADVQALVDRLPGALDELIEACAPSAARSPDAIPSGDRERRPGHASARHRDREPGEPRSRVPDADLGTRVDGQHEPGGRSRDHALEGTG